MVLCFYNMMRQNRPSNQDEQPLVSVKAPDEKLDLNKHNAIFGLRNYKIKTSTYEKKQ